MNEHANGQVRRVRCLSGVAQVCLFVLWCVPISSYGQVMTLGEALEATSANNRAIRSAELQREKAAEDLRIARTHRLPIFSVTTLASQPLTQLGVTFEQGSLGSYPSVGPIPGRTTTLKSPLQFGMIFFASVAQPLTQQYRMGLGIESARI